MKRQTKQIDFFLRKFWLVLMFIAVCLFFFRAFPISSRKRAGFIFRPRHPEPLLSSVPTVIAERNQQIRNEMWRVMEFSSENPFSHFSFLGNISNLWNHIFEGREILRFNFCSNHRLQRVTLQVATGVLSCCMFQFEVSRETVFLYLRLIN